MGGSKEETAVHYKSILIGMEMCVEEAERLTLEFAKNYGISQGILSNPVAARGAENTLNVVAELMALVERKEELFKEYTDTMSSDSDMEDIKTSFASGDVIEKWQGIGRNLGKIANTIYMSRAMGQFDKKVDYFMNTAERLKEVYTV